MAGYTAGLISCGNPSFTATCLLWAKLTILVFGLVLLISGQLFSSHGGDEDVDHAGLTLRSSSPRMHDDNQRSYSAYNNEGRGGFVSYMFSSLIGSRKGGNKELLCEFKGDEVLPKHVLLKKLVECYKVLSSKNVGNGLGGNVDGRSGAISYSTNRRLLRNSDIDHEAPFQKSKTSATRTNPELNLQHHAATITSSIAQDNNIEAAFHIDYNGPKTHPPKNN